MIIYVYNKLCLKGTKSKIDYIIKKLKEIYHELIVVDFISFRNLSYQHIKVLIISGGDGSINRIINETIKYNITYAFIPLGTANDFSHNLGITSVKKGIKVIKNQNRILYEVAKVNGKVFLYGLSIGKINKIPLKVNKNSKKCFRKLTYIINGIKNSKFQKEKIILNNKEYLVSGIIILKTKYLGGLRIFNSLEEYNMVIIKNIWSLIKLFLLKQSQNNLFKIYIDNNVLCLDGEKYILNSKDKQLHFTYDVIKIYK